MHTTRSCSCRIYVVERSVRSYCHHHPSVSLRLWVLILLLIWMPPAADTASAQCRLGVNSHGSQTLVLLPSGVVAAFGYNNSGQVGNGTRQNPAAPIRVQKGEYEGMTFLGDDPTNPIVDIAALYRHSLAVDAAGVVYGWGANNSGELGYQPLGNQLAPIRVRRGSYPGTMYLGDDRDNPITALSGGINSSMVLAQDGMLYGFGRNDHGQLGDGSIDTSSLPERVLKGEYPGAVYLGDDPANPVVAVAGGDYHYLALTRDGGLYAWGRNSDGQLGVGDTLSRSAPVRVLKGSYPGTTYIGDDPTNGIVMIRAGGSASLVLLVDGTAMMWGGNALGKVGDNTTEDRHAPVFVEAGEYPGTTYFGDSPLHPVRDISVGSTHVVALCDDGRTYSWGSNLFGNLGTGPEVGQLSSTPRRVLRGEYPGEIFFGDAEGDPVLAVTAGEDFTIAIVDTCALYGWGRNQRQQLVESSLSDHPTPIRLPELPVDGPSSVVTLDQASTANVVHVAPLPIGTRATIEYSITEPGWVHLDLFSAAGAHVSALVDDYKFHGTHRCIVDATQLPPGLYYCRLNAGDRTTTQLLVVTK